MTKQVDLDEPEDDEETRRQSAEDKLRQAGVTPAGARAVVELFTRVSHDEELTATEPDA